MRAGHEDPFLGPLPPSGGDKTWNLVHSLSVGPVAVPAAWEALGSRQWFQETLFSQDGKHREALKGPHPSPGTHKPLQAVLGVYQDASGPTPESRAPSPTTNDSQEEHEMRAEGQPTTTHTIHIKMTTDITHPEDLGFLEEALLGLMDDLQISGMVTDFVIYHGDDE